MPRRIQWLAPAWDQLQDLPGLLSKEALTLAGALMVDPFPAAAEVYDAVPDTYRINSGHVTLIYRTVGDEIDIVLVRANT